jgi:hypothetical protein
MLERVRERLLHDPVGDQIQVRRQRRQFTLDVELDRQSGSPGPFG